MLGSVSACLILSPLSGLWSDREFATMFSILSILKLVTFDYLTLNPDEP